MLDETSSSGRLDGRICLVTGGASGIGAATVALFAREGATLASVDLQPARRGALGRPEDAAYALLFLASDESRFVLGSGLSVDGGLGGTRS